jgi:hypothetical protein
MSRAAQALALVVATATVGLVSPAAAHATVPAKYANCTNLRHYYPHGVGQVGAHDHVTSGRPVTTWTHNTNAYNVAIHNNARLDADHDHVACEKA